MVKKYNIARIPLMRRLFNGYREVKLKCKYYDKSSCTQYYRGVIFCVDGHINHGGLADRFNGIICSYALCKVHNIEFKLHYNYPFDLTAFLVPAVESVDWVCQSSLITYSRRDSAPLVLLGDHNWHNKFPCKQINKQIHLYGNIYILDKINKKYNTSFTYADLYNELFQPSLRLQNVLAKSLGQLPEKYNSVCIRFQNAFGDFKEAAFKELSKCDQNALMQTIHSCIDTLILREGLPVLVTADSPHFLASIQSLPNVYSVYKGLGSVHMDYNGDSELDIYEQSFIDYYALSKGEKIFSIIGNNLYQSGFPVFAANIVNKKVVYININHTPSCNKI